MRKSGYIHAIAYFCFRDHVIGIGDQLRAADYAKLFSSDRLIRTEISTLIGLLLRAPRDLALPGQEVLAQYLERTDALLRELHEALNEPGRAAMRAAMADPSKAANPFTVGAVCASPYLWRGIAYPSQYRDLSVLKYGRDDAWLTTNKGFTVEEAKKVVAAICDFLNDNLLSALKGLKELPPDQRTMLAGFEFPFADIVTRSGLVTEKSMLSLPHFAFLTTAIPPSPRFMSLMRRLHSLFKGPDGKYNLFLYASLTEALYETPFYWMGADKAYEATAMTNRGLFSEYFTADRLAKVFGNANVFRNVDIWETKARKKKISEVDTLVLFGDRAIAVQAKSKKLTLAARKGNDLQMQTDFKGAVQDPAIRPCYVERTYSPTPRLSLTRTVMSLRSLRSSRFILSGTDGPLPRFELSGSAVPYLQGNRRHQRAARLRRVFSGRCDRVSRNALAFPKLSRITCARR